VERGECLLLSAPARGPYDKGKDSDKGNFKGKDKSLPDWSPQFMGLPKVSPKVEGIAQRVLTKASLG